MANLATDYLAAKEDLAPFFAQAPSAFLEDPTLHGTWNADFRNALLDYQQTLGLDRTIPDNASVVITGQQPGFFTGPLYTIYKAITAILLAENVEAKTGQPCVPIFWIGADDHDFEEVRAANVLTKKHALEELRFEPQTPADNTPMYQLPMAGNVEELLTSLQRVVPASELGNEIFAFLQDTHDPDQSFSHYFARIMARLFRDTKLLFFTTEIPEARRLAAPILEKEIRNPLESTQRANVAGTALEDLGYSAQVVKNPEECNFFFDKNGKRCKVLWQDSQFHLPDVNESLTQETMLDLLESTPEAFTPNVILRPVVQQMLFPATAYIGGPGEIAYWAQLKNVFQFFDQPMPAVYPRLRAVLTTLKLNKLLANYVLSTEDLYRPEADILESCLEKTAQNPALNTFRSERSSIDDAVQNFTATVKQSGKKNRDLPQHLEDLESQVNQALSKLERTLTHADKAQVSTVEQQVQRLCQSLAPGRKPQERVLSIVSYLPEHGWELIPRLINAFDINDLALQEIEL